MTLAMLVVPLLAAAALAGWRARGSEAHRVTRAAGATAVVLLGWSLMGLGEGTGVDWSLAVVGLPVVAFVAAARLGPVRAAPDRWSTPWVPSSAVPQRDPSSARSVRTALGRVEARELARSPWFGAGIGFCLLLFYLFGISFVTDATTWEAFAELAPWLAHPLVGLTVVASHRSVTRARRDDAEELFAVCPASPEIRTTGFLLAAWIPVAALSVLFVALGVALALRGESVHGPVGLDLVALVAAGVVLAPGGVALGVALGRWARFGLVPVAAVAAVAFASLGLNGVGGTGWHPVTMLSTAPTVEDVSPVFQNRPAWWHLVWVGALVVLTAQAAVARHRRDRRLVRSVVATAIVLVVGGIMATRPMSDAEARELAALVAEPESHQFCLETPGPLEVCGFEYHRDLVQRVRDRVAPVAAALPGGLDPLVLRQSYERELRDLPPEVRRRLTPADLVRPAGEVALGFGNELSDLTVDPGFRVAFAAVGIPPVADESRIPSVVAGQARGVVALWLATRGLDAESTARASNSPNAGSSDPFDRGSLLVSDVCSVPAVVWSGQDLAAARSVLAVAEEEVARVVARDWGRWSDPSTGTDELLAALGLGGHGPYDRVEARAGVGC